MVARDTQRTDPDGSSADGATSPDGVTPDEVTHDDVTHDADLADIPSLSYEQARDELIGIVARLEGGQAPLEESMTLWHRGEALAQHCARWLDAAQSRIEAREDPQGQPAGETK